MKSITVTLIFEGSALNRDEKVDQNTLSVKRLTRPTGEHTFISKPAIRHYLFQTLYRMNPHRWEATPTVLQGSGQQKTLQFDLSRADITTHAEIDAFGYMYTVGGQKAITRKAPVGITKAVSLEPYMGDIAFYANHDLASRHFVQGHEPSKGVPGIYGKEEHISFYKLSITIDSGRIGVDQWILDEAPKVHGQELILKLPDNREKRLKIQGTPVSSPEGTRVLLSHGTLQWTQEQVEKTTKYFVTFQLNEEERKERIRDLLEALRNGLIAQSSGEANTLTPVFFLAAPVRVPSPIFHPKIDLMLDRQGFRIRGIQDALANGWREDPVYLYVSERLEAEVLQEDGMYVDRGSREHWETWVNAVLNTNLSP